jgi:purine/pyrimidine-nucleoside phosphorylase
MEIQSGVLSYCLSGQTEWHSVQGGECFDVPGSSSFKVRVTEITDYVCSFL